MHQDIMKYIFHPHIDATIHFSNNTSNNYGVPHGTSFAIFRHHKFDVMKTQYVWFLVHWYSGVPLQRGQIYYDITNGAAMTTIEHKSDIELITDTPYFTGELWGVYYENFEENWPCYNGTAMYVGLLPNCSSQLAERLVYSLAPCSEVVSTVCKWEAHSVPEICNVYEQSAHICGRFEKYGLTDKTTSWNGLYTYHSFLLWSWSLFNMIT